MIMTELIKSLQSVLMFDGLLTHISLGQKPEFQMCDHVYDELDASELA